MLKNTGHGLESSRTAGTTSGHSWGAAVEADTIREQQEVTGRAKLLVHVHINNTLLAVASVPAFVACSTKSSKSWAHKHEHVILA